MAVRNHSPKATSPSSRPRASVKRQASNAKPQTPSFKRQALNAQPHGPRRIPCSGSQVARLTDGVNAKSLGDAAAYPLFATPDGLRKDRFTNVAAVRRCVRIKSEFAGTPWSFAWRRCCRKAEGQGNGNGKNRQKLPLSFGFCARKG